MTERSVRFAGSGGQGIALAALLLADGAVRAGANATHAQAYGPESRGGASRADVIVSDGPIVYPIPRRIDALVALTQESCDRYLGDLATGGLLIVDADAVRAPDRADVDAHSLPITATARRVLGATLGANLVALGALLALTDLVPADAIEGALRGRRVGGDPDHALRALHAGLALARRAEEGVPM